MKKLTVGIKENDRVIFLRTEEVSDEFSMQQFIKTIGSLLNIFIKRDNYIRGGDNSNNSKQKVSDENEF